MSIVPNGANGVSPSSSAMVQLPAGGVKFSPTEGELLSYFLYNHIHGKLPQSLYRLIPCYDLYGTQEPWEVWQLLQSGETPGDVYAFTSLKKKVISGGGLSKRAGRRVGKGNGRWHAEDVGTKFNLVRKGNSEGEMEEERWIGTRRRYSYKNPNFREHMKWILHEFSLKKDDGFSEEGTEVVCMIRNKGSPAVSAFVEAANKSVLEGRKKKLQDLINRFSSGSSDPVPQQPQQQATLPSFAVADQCSYPAAGMMQQGALPSAMMELPYPAAPLLPTMMMQSQQQMQQYALPSTMMECSYPETTPLLMIEPQQQQQDDLISNNLIEWFNFVGAMEKPQHQRQPHAPLPSEGGEQNSSPFDITSKINFDIPEGFELGWGNLGGGSDFQVLSEQELNLPLYQLQAPAPAEAYPMAEGDHKGAEETMVAAAAIQADEGKEMMVVQAAAMERKDVQPFSFKPQQPYVDTPMGYNHYNPYNIWGFGLQ